MKQAPQLPSRPCTPEHPEDSERSRNYGANTTLMASLSRQGMGEAFILEGAADAGAFELYIEQILAPSLRSGQIVIMDNLSILKARAGATGH